MKTVATFMLASAALAGAAPGAAAFKLAPPSTSFSGGGGMTLTGPAGSASCRVFMLGSVNKRGRGQITGLRLVSSGESNCGGATAIGLPWKVKAVGASSAKIVRLTINSTVGMCGPATVKMAVDAGGGWSINAPAPPACTLVNASLVTSPAIGIVP